MKLHTRCVGWCSSVTCLAQSFEAGAAQYKERELWNVLPAQENKNGFGMPNKITQGKKKIVALARVVWEKAGCYFRNFNSLNITLPSSEDMMGTPCLPLLECELFTGYKCTEKMFYGSSELFGCYLLSLTWGESRVQKSLSVNSWPVLISISKLSSFLRYYVHIYISQGGVLII